MATDCTGHRSSKIEYASRTYHVRILFFLRIHLCSLALKYYVIKLPTGSHTFRTTEF